MTLNPDIGSIKLISRSINWLKNYKFFNKLVKITFIGLGTAIAKYRLNLFRFSMGNEGSQGNGTKLIISNS